MEPLQPGIYHPFPTLSLLFLSTLVRKGVRFTQERLHPRVLPSPHRVVCPWSDREEGTSDGPCTGTFDTKISLTPLISPASPPSPL